MANTKAIGVAYEDQKISGGTVDNTPIGATTASTGAFTTLAASGAAALSGDVDIGDASTDLIGFHGATAVDQAAFIATVTASTTITAVVAAVNTILTLLSEKGLMAAS